MQYLLFTRKTTGHPLISRTHKKTVFHRENCNFSENRSFQVGHTCVSTPAQFIL